MAGVVGLAFVLGHRAPDAVGLADPQGVLATLLEHRAREADLFGLGVAGPASRASLTLGVEEDLWVDLATRAVKLPFPQVSDWSRKP
jgi:hypothetical protein